MSSGGPVRNRIQPGDGDPRHGMYSSYTNHACRCELCRAANFAQLSRRRKERQLTLTPDDPRHGKASTYFNHKCRCRRCKDARNEYERNRKARAVA